jgi:hypothetical protein
MRFLFALYLVYANSGLAVQLLVLSPQGFDGVGGCVT